MYSQKALMLSVLAPASAFSTFRGVGRIVAFALMVGGITMLATVTATLASWLG